MIESLKETTMNAAFLKAKFDAGLDYQAYVATGNDDQRQRWNDFQSQVELDGAQRELIAGFRRQMKIVVLSGVWCGDCVQQVPLIHAISNANPEQLQVRYLDRDQHSDVQDQHLLNAGRRVPVAIFAAEDFEPCGWFGDRTLNRYRRMYQQYKNPACETGIGSVAADAVARELQDWIDQFERIQYMLLLSPRLCKIHGD